MAGLERQVFFLQTPRGPLFCSLIEPCGEIRGSLLYVPPFTEEMNKSRRMAALAAQHFAAQGWRVLQFDLSGTGDSAGEFVEAGWDAWLEDVSLAWEWLAQYADNSLPMALWALRGGALLASSWLAQARVQAPLPLLLWQPVLAGKQWLSQFLRLKAANEMLAEGDAGKVMKELKAALAAGQTVEVAGYGLHPQLAAGLEAAVLTFRPDQLSRLEVFELGSGERQQPTPALALACARWIEAGVACRIELVSGPAFWNTVDIEEAPALIEASCRVLEEWL